MATKNISITEEAYGVLVSLRQNEKESFSNVVKRMKKKIKLSDFHGIISKETGDALEKGIQETREIHRKKHRERIERLKKEFN